MENIIVHKFFTLGFYPEDLPPEFKVTGVEPDFIQDFIQELDSFDPLAQGRKSSTPIQFSIPKNNQSRRWFHLLNPLHFIRLSNSFQVNWTRIADFCNGSELSTSKINLSEDSDKVFHKGPFRESVRERVSRSAGRKLMLSMDITNFYPSIYSHSLEWIFEGRRLIGRERHNRAFVGVALDQDIRNSQSGKTNGIAIGPETSRVISEIIGAYLDAKLKETGVDFEGTRYVDDYHLYFNNQADLEKIRLTLQTELNKLNLASNEAKSDVINVPEVFEASWVQHLTKLEFRTTPVGLQKDLISAFSLAFQNAKNHSKDFSIKFLISMLFRKEITYTDESKELLLELLRHSIEQDARAMSRAFQLLYKTNAFGSADKFKKLFQDKLETDSQLGKTYEVLWILHGYRKLQIPVSQFVVQNIIEQCDVLSITYLLLMSESNLIEAESKSALIEFIEGSISEFDEPFLSNFWLPLYEGDKRGWWEISCEKPEFINHLQRNNISFLSAEDEIDWNEISVSSYPEFDEFLFEEEDTTDETIY